MNILEAWDDEVIVNMDDPFKEDLYYRGVDAEHDQLMSSKPITWFTTSEKYARSFAWGLSGKGTLYTCKLYFKKALELDDLTERVYTNYPVDPPYKVRDDFKAQIAGLKLSDEELDKVLEQVIQDGHFYSHGYRLTISNLISSRHFIIKMLEAGYDAVSVLEFDRSTHTFARSVGIFSESNVNVITKEVSSDKAVDEKGKPYEVKDQYEPGDILKIQPDYLEAGENPDEEYVAFNDYGDGKTEVFSWSDSRKSAGLHTWATYMFYWTGKHYDLSKDKTDSEKLGHLKTIYMRKD